MIIDEKVHPPNRKTTEMVQHVLVQNWLKEHVLEWIDIFNAILEDFPIILMTHPVWGVSLKWSHQNVERLEVKDIIFFLDISQQTFK